MDNRESVGARNLDYRINDYFKPSNVRFSKKSRDIETLQHSKKDHLRFQPTQQEVV